MDKVKHQKFFPETLDINNEEDKISQLPDCILHHILSFLPTKDTFGTCLLSTRWKNLWTFVPNIDFDDSLLYTSGASGCNHFIEENCFMNFVERVLLLRDGSNVKKFRLSCRVCFSSSRVHAWVSNAMRHNVEELDLCLFVEKPLMLPLCVFNSNLLTGVKIEMNCVLELPTCISFPCLKTLHLGLVTFPNDNLTQKLFSSCPVLQDLAILDCDWMNLKSVAISIPTLKRLTMDDLPFFGSTDDLHGCEIKIDAANLVLLKYIGYLSNEIFLYNLSSLVDAYIHISILPQWREEIAYRVIKLLRELWNVSSVRMCNGTIESPFSAGNVLDHLPVFQKLIHMELSMKIENHTVGPLMELLQCAPNLQCIHFVEGLDPRMCLGEDVWISKSVPKCLSSCLKTISLWNFCGNDAEIWMLKFLLRNALVLERINIFCSKVALGDCKKQNEVRNQVQMLPRGSTSCIITFW